MQTRVCSPSPTVSRWCIPSLGKILGTKRHRVPIATKNQRLDATIWQRGWDSSPQYRLTPYNGLANRRLQPLGHPSAGMVRLTTYAAPVIQVGAQGVKPGTRPPA